MAKAKSWVVGAVLAVVMAAPIVAQADQFRGFDRSRFDHRSEGLGGPANARPFCHVPPPRPYAYAPYHEWDRHQRSNPWWSRRHEFQEQRWDRDRYFRRDRANPYARREHRMRERERFDPRMGELRERHERRQQAYADPYASGYAYPQGSAYGNGYAPGTAGDPRFDAAVGMIPLAQQMFNRNP